MMKISILISFLFFYFISSSQSKTYNEYILQKKGEFESFRNKYNREFEEYRNRVNEEYARYMENLWTEYATEPPIPLPDTPEYPTPVMAEPDASPLNEPMPFKTVVPLPDDKPRSKPEPFLPPDDSLAPTPKSTPKPEPKPTPTPALAPSVPCMVFDYYGQSCAVPFDNSLKISLSNLNEKTVANAWSVFSSDKSIPTLKSAIAYKNQLGLSDWGYLLFLDKLAEKAFSSRKNEANLLKMFLLTQSGYKVRIGRHDNRLVPLIPCDDLLYNYSFVFMEGTKYYIPDRSLDGGSTFIYDREFPKEQKFDLTLDSFPELPDNPSNVRKLRSKFDNLTVDVTVNRNLIDFLNDYPLTSSWNIYSEASLSQEAKKQLYPVLRKAIKDKDEKAAVNVLLHFVQTAFEYATDVEQFGEERPLFADESLFYPFNDCEDRAILFSILVKDLLGLESVLLNYPDHLAAAVNFKEEVTGDYLTVDGRKYVVCDPTYINSNVGMAMPQCRGESAQVVKIR